jgi:anaerobic selenocysteine-containing dehydrogenase
VSSKKDRNRQSGEKDVNSSRRDFLKKAPAAMAGLVVMGGMSAGLGGLARAAWGSGSKGVGGAQEAEVD